MQRDFYRSLLAKHYPVLLAGGGKPVARGADLPNAPGHGAATTTALKNLVMQVRKVWNGAGGG